MRSIVAHARLTAFSCFTLLLAAACGGELPSAPGQDGPGDVKPLANHVAHQLSVNVNNYQLTFQRELLGNSSYKGTPVLFSGGLAYGNAPDAAFIYDTRGLPAPGFNVEFSRGMPGVAADRETVSLLSERVDDSAGPSNPIGLSVVRQTLAYSSAPDDDYVIIKYTLFNGTGAQVTGLHVGEILDPDLFVNAVQNQADFEAGNQVSRTTSTGDPVAHGHVLLSHPVGSYSSWVSGGDPTDLAGYFAALSGGIVGAAPIGPADVRQLLTTGPVDIPAGGSLVVFSAIVGGDDTADLSTNIAAARAMYSALPAAVKAATPIAEVSVAPGKVKEKKPDFSSDFTFADRATAELLDPLQTFCGSAPGFQADVRGATVTVKFLQEELDPRLREGDEMSCGGVLSDGSVFGARIPARFKNQFISTVTQLTSTGTNYGPTWSPDGSSIAYMSAQAGVASLHTMDAGIGEASATQLTAGGVGVFSERHPDWSPDGSVIAFARDGAILTVPASGGVETALTNGASGDQDPRWSPDGSEIAFRRFNHIFTMDAAGELAGDPADLVAIGGVFDVHPDWATDGLIYMLTRRDGSAFTIFSVDPDNPEPGTPAVRVTPNEGSDDRHPSVSPDASVMAFISTTGAGREIILQDLATGDHTVVLLDMPVAINPASESQNLEISPDGDQVVFSAVVGSQLQIFVADISGLR